MEAYKVESSIDIAFIGESIKEEKYFTLKIDAEFYLKKWIQDLIINRKIDINQLRIIIDNDIFWWCKDLHPEHPDEYAIFITPIDVE